MKTFDELGYKVILIPESQIGSSELDNENDFWDLIAEKLKVDVMDFEEVMSGWDIDEQAYVTVVKITK